MWHLFIPPGTAMPASLCFACDSFLNVALLVRHRWTDCNADCCVNTVDEKYHGYKFGELWSSKPRDLDVHLHGWRLQGG